jgi:NAD(P)-dependent dehydrogenase (short-subunit alcohol dehydrogenase family)
MSGNDISIASPRVVVTGCSAGAGRAIAERFGAAGWRVALLARDRARLDHVARRIRTSGGEALMLPTDVSDADALDRARDAVVGAWQGIDVWVNCAMATVVAPIAHMTSAEYRRVTEVTYLGCVNGTLAALKVMRAAGAGRIVQVGSALAYRSIPLQSAYCAAKAAVRGFTDALRSELRHERSAIGLTMIQLPGMNTPQFDWARNKFDRKYRPVGTVYRPEVAADAVWRAATARRAPRELWVGASAIEAIAGQLAAPWLLDRKLAHSAWEGQISDEPETPGRADNLFETVPGDYGIDGRFGAEAKPRAWTIDPQRARLGVAAAMGLLVAGLVARRRVESPD